MKKRLKPAKMFARITTGAIIFALTVSSLAMIPSDPVSAAACSAPTTDYGSATASVAIPSADTYRIWSRMLAPDTTNNTYLLEVDGNNCYTVGGALQPNTWVWVSHQNGTTSSKIDLSLTKGNHALKFIGKQPGVMLDRVVFSSDLNCVPVGNGDNCNTPADTTVPTVNLTSPTDNATVSGTVNITADASDNTGVREVEFYVNSTKLGTDASSPYSYQWDTKTATNGTVSVIAKAYDTAGNSNTDNVTVTVQNQTSDTQPPSAPGNVQATALAYNKTQVTWQASTDNVAVTGYRILRNGSPLAQVGRDTTSYQDNTVFAGTTYKYKVVALDAAGNVSQASNEGTVTTPNTPDSVAPTAPAELSATGVNAKQINLSWQASTDNIGVKEYEVYRWTSGGNPQKIATVTATNFGDAGLEAAVEYSYHVKAKDAAGNLSEPSNTSTAKTTAKKRVAVLRGEVHGSNQSTHLKGAEVQVGTQGSSYKATTNRHGRFVIRDIPRGKYTITFSAEGYRSKSVSRNLSTAKVWQEITLSKKR